MYSDLVLEELVNAPIRVRLLATSLPWNSIERLKRSQIVEDLTNAYIDNDVINAKSFDDCMHIAFATVYKADVLISWNFKHIVNTTRIKGFNFVNLKRGFNTIKIISPKTLY